MNAADKKMLDDLTAGFPALAGELKEALQKAQAIQQKLAAHASMFAAYGWPIPEVEGVTIQAGPLSPAAHAALLAAHKEQVIVPIQPAPTINSPQTARELVRKVLKNSSNGMTVHEVRKAIRNEYGQAFANSSIYRILMQDCTNDGGGRWRLKK